MVFGCLVLPQEASPGVETGAADVAVNRGPGQEAFESLGYPECGARVSTVEGF